jgi:hypothetical protein
MDRPISNRGVAGVGWTRRLMRLDCHASTGSGLSPSKCAVRGHQRRRPVTTCQCYERESSKPAADPRDLPYSCQLLLLLHLRLDLNLARLDALLQGKRQAQHSMAMRGGEFLEIEELRNHQCLFVARNVLVSALARNLSANGEIVAGDLEGHVLRIDAGQRNAGVVRVGRSLQNWLKRRSTSRWKLNTSSNEFQRVRPNIAKPPCFKPPRKYIRHARFHVKYL